MTYASKLGLLYFLISFQNRVSDMLKTVLLAIAIAVSYPAAYGIAAEQAHTLTAQPAAAPTFTEAQKAEIENIVKDYLTNKRPEVLAEGIQNLQKREQAEAESKTKEGVNKEKNRLFNDPASPVAGNPKGSVTVVEFYDYQCGYCKLSEEGIEKLLKEDKDVRFVYKNFPVLGPVSVEAAKAGLAAAKQGKFQVFHTALMMKKEHLNSDLIYKIAKDAGLNVEKLKKDMADPALTETLNNDLKLGQDIGVRGTPMFVVSNGAVYPGALQYEQMKKAVSDARAEPKKP